MRVIATGVEQLRTRDDSALLCARIVKILGEKWTRCFSWNRARARHVELTPRMVVAQCGEWEVRRGVTSAAYAFDFRASPGPGVVEARCVLLEGALDGEPDGAVPLHLTVELDEATGPDEARSWVRLLAKELPAQWVTAGPQEVIEKAGTGWLTFFRGVDRPSGLDATLVEQVPGGTIITAHPLDPSATSIEAVLFARAVARALELRVDLGESAGQAETPKLDIPTYLQPDVSPDETAMVPRDQVLAPALPFAGSTTRERLTELTRPSEDVSELAGVDPHETLMMPLAATLAKVRSGSFVDELGSVVVPVLSLEEYADLRAELGILGEEDTATLQRFGVMTAAAHVALKSRFAEYFKRDPAVQTEFVEAVRQRIARLRAAGSAPR